jgi:hypothetical protein
MASGDRACSERFAFPQRVREILRHQIGRPPVRYLFMRLKGSIVMGLLESFGSCQDGVILTMIIKHHFANTSTCRDKNDGSRIPLDPPTAVQHLPYIVRSSSWISLRSRAALPPSFCIPDK